MRGERANRVILEKIIQYCDNAEHICHKHENARKVFEEDTEFQYACGIRCLNTPSYVTYVTHQESMVDSS